MYNYGRGHLQLHFQKCSFSKCKIKSVKIKKSSEALEWSKKSFVRRFENDTFDSVFFKSVEIERVVVSAHPQFLICPQKDKESLGSCYSKK